MKKFSRRKISILVKLHRLRNDVENFIETWLKKREREKKKKGNRKGKSYYTNEIFVRNRNLKGIRYRFNDNLRISVKPLVVNITNKEAHLSALKTYEIECASSGSRPEAVITWWKGNHQVKHMARNVSRTFFSLCRPRLISLSARQARRELRFWVLRSLQIVQTSREACWVTCRLWRTMASIWSAGQRIQL